MNRIRISGCYGTKTRFDDKHVSTIMTTKRKSNADDNVKVVFSEILEKEINGYDKIVVEGELRSRKSNGFPKNELYVLAEKVEPYYKDEDINEVSVSGKLTIQPTFRTTITGFVISDCPISIPQDGTKKSTLLSCIAWGKVAKTAKMLEKNSEVFFNGRLQSRDFIKDGEEYTINELSISTIL